MRLELLAWLAAGSASAQHVTTRGERTRPISEYKERWPKAQRMDGWCERSRTLSASGEHTTSREGSSGHCDCNPGEGMSGKGPLPGCRHLHPVVEAAGVAAAEAVGGSTNGVRQCVQLRGLLLLI
jgi:hypothetical protein